MGMRRSGIGWLVVLGALGYLVVPVSPALGYTAGPPSPASMCVAAVVGNELALEARLAPSNGASVQAGTPVTFSGYSGAPVTFAVASSAALLSTPDIDSGLGSAQPENLYTFTSTKATATAGTVYWDASFSSETLKGCEGLTPTTYTTSVRTLTVLPPPSPPMTASVPTTTATTTTPPAPTGSVSLDGSTINVQNSGRAQVKLACTGTATCSGKLALTGKSTPKKGKKAKAQTIGTATFSIPAGKTATIELKLNAAGKALLNADHGRLGATLSVLKSSPIPSQTHTATVQLVA
jgi:hypothetical protein